LEHKTQEQGEIMFEIESGAQNAGGDDNTQACKALRVQECKSTKSIKSAKTQKA
jgi:hypothetical protein